MHTRRGKSRKSGLLSSSLTALATAVGGAAKYAVPNAAAVHRVKGNAHILLDGRRFDDIRQMYALRTCSRLSADDIVKYAAEAAQR